MIHLLESRIFNRESLRMIADRLKEKKGEGKEEQQERAQQLADRLYELEAAIKILQMQLFEAYIHLHSERSCLNWNRKKLLWKQSR